MQIPRQWHNHEAHPLRRPQKQNEDEEQIMKKKKKKKKKLLWNHRRSALERSAGKLLVGVVGKAQTIFFFLERNVSRFSRVYEFCWFTFTIRLKILLMHRIKYLLLALIIYIYIYIYFFFVFYIATLGLQCDEHLWDNDNLFYTWVVRASGG